MYGDSFELPNVEDADLLELQQLESLQKFLLSTDARLPTPPEEQPPASEPQGAKSSASRKRKASTSSSNRPSKKTYPSRKGVKLQNRSCEKCKKDKKKCFSQEGFEDCKYCYDKNVPCERRNIDKRRKSQASEERQGQTVTIPDQTPPVQEQTIAVPAQPQPQPGAQVPGSSFSNSLVIGDNGGDNIGNMHFINPLQPNSQPCVADSFVPALDDATMAQLLASYNKEFPPEFY
jgi:hypothetical protein